MIEMDLSSSQFLSLAEEMLKNGRVMRFRAKGDSMRPLICDGDLLTILPIEQRPARLGDVVLFEDGKHRALVHRIVQKRDIGRQRFLLTWGDAAQLPDGYTPVGKVLGKVSQVQRLEKTISLESLPHRLWAFGMAVGLPVYKRTILLKNRR